MFKEINILPTYSPINPKAIRIAPENIVTETKIDATPEGTLSSTILSIKNTTAITANDKRPIPIKRRILKSPCLDCSSACPIAPGIPVSMLVAMMIDIPFP